MTPHQRIRRRQRQQRRRYNRRLRNQNPNLEDDQAWGAGQPDWPQEEFEVSHCDLCHETHQGTWHQCTFIPGFDQETCPTCNGWQVISPYQAHPVLYLLLIPYLDQTLRVGLELVNALDYQPFWKRFLIQFVGFFVASYLARQI